MSRGPHKRVQVIPYFGSKFRIARSYPYPKHDRIIEPFAGSAGYSQFHWGHDILLTDVDDNIVDVWKYLISATQADILDLPDITRETDVRDLDISRGAKLLIGFNMNPGNSYPCNFVTSFGENDGVIAWNEKKRKIAKIIDRFNHWKIEKRSFSKIDNQIATWFIDPPYVYGGDNYKHHKVNFAQIKKFSLEREGEIIVCENSKANWLPFKMLRNNRGRFYTNKEVIYHSIDNPIRVG